MNEFYCPLYNLNLDDDIKFMNDELEISTDLKLKKMNSDILEFLSIVKDELSKNEYEFIIKSITYWLHIETNFNTEIIYIFQLVSWIVKPTKLRICFLINSANIAEDGLKEDNFSKLKEFIYIPAHVEPCFNNKDITKLKRIFPILLGLYQNKPIFYNAVGLNFQGCVAFHWEAAYILYVTTFEALLTHKSKWGIKKMLSWAYAILTETQDVGRQKAFNEFREIYQIRSEILHGESFKDKYKKGDINLEELAKCRDMLRKLWLKILYSKDLQKIISKNDRTRRRFFHEMSNGWRPKIELENII